MPPSSIMSEFDSPVPSPRPPVVSIVLTCQFGDDGLSVAYFNFQPFQERYTMCGSPAASMAMEGFRPVSPDESTTVFVHAPFGTPVE